MYPMMKWELVADLAAPGLVAGQDGSPRRTGLPYWASILWLRACGNF